MSLDMYCEMCHDESKLAKHVNVSVTDHASMGARLCMRCAREFDLWLLMSPEFRQLCELTGRLDILLKCGRSDMEKVEATSISAQIVDLSIAVSVMVIDRLNQHRKESNDGPDA